MKRYDVVVKVGEYQKDGSTKARNKTIGAVMENRNGGLYLLLDRSFNLAAVPVDGNRDSVLCSLFEPRPMQGQPISNDDGIPF
jgi:hypothetical protein